MIDNPCMRSCLLTARYYCFFATLLVMLAMTTGCSDGLTELERIKQRGTLRVAILASPPVFFPDESMLRGFDYQLVSNFATQLNCQLDLMTANTIGEMQTLLKQGKVHIGIADSAPLVTTDNILSSQGYNNNEWYVIGNRANPLPKQLDEIRPGRLVVAENSGPSLVLQELKQQFRFLNWVELPGGNTRQVLQQVHEKRFRLTVVNADLYTYYRQLYPEIKIAFILKQEHPTRWMMLKRAEPSLVNAINRYLEEVTASGELEKLNATYFRHLKLFRYVDNVHFLERIRTTLPSYQTLFASAASENVFDERFLAAVSYQESHWDKDAVSMTGVRGLMMLTQMTAKRVGVTDRLDPEQSINGGARYLAILRESLPEDILEPDRSWMTLAAYNIGLGHLEDARILTEKAGDDPHLWIDVEKHLPRLSEKKWYQQTRYGYARGQEPVVFVRRIRRYFDILRLYQQEALLEKFNKPIDFEKLQLNSPIL